MNQKASNKMAAPRTATEGRLETHDEGNSITNAAFGKTSLGWTLFHSPFGGAHSVSEIRQRLELKAAAVLTKPEGFNGFPPSVDEIRDLRLRSLVACGLIFTDWSVMDLTEITGGLGEVASSVLIETLESPRWSSDDLALLRLVGRIENLSRSAWRGAAA